MVWRPRGPREQGQDSQSWRLWRGPWWEQRLCWEGSGPWARAVDGAQWSSTSKGVASVDCATSLQNRGSALPRGRLRTRITRVARLARSLARQTVAGQQLRLQEEKRGSSHPASWGSRGPTRDASVAEGSTARGQRLPFCLFLPEVHCTTRAPLSYLDRSD